MAANKESQPMQKRLAIFTESDGQKDLVAKLTIKAGDKDNVVFDIEAAVEDDLKRVGQLLEAARDGHQKAPQDATLDEIVESFRSFAVRTLEEAGFGTEDISAGDVQINIEFDLNSGRRFATQRGLHDFNTGGDDTIGMNVFKAVAGVLEQISNDIAEEIDRAVAAGDPTAILTAVRMGDKKGAFTLQPTKKLLEVLFSFDVTRFDAADRKFIRERRLCVAHLLKRWDLAGAEAETLLRDHAEEYDDCQKADFEMELANAATQKGHRETALLIWRRLLRSPDKLEPGNRGWAWSNIALASPPESRERRHAAMKIEWLAAALCIVRIPSTSVQRPFSCIMARRRRWMAAKCSADAFLEAGDKEKASQSLMMLANALLFEEPSKALETIGEIVNLIEEKGLRNRALRAATYHTRGNRLLQMGKHAEAATDAITAADQLRGLMGAEEQLISALHLAAIACEAIGESDQAKNFRREADKLTEETNSSHFKMAHRVEALLREFDATASRRFAARR